MRIFFCKNFCFRFFIFWCEWRIYWFLPIKSSHSKKSSLDIAILFQYTHVNENLIFIFFILMTTCIKCKSTKTRKHGHGRNNSQRFFCGACQSTFTIDGKRGTYSPEFKEAVVDAYCHQKNTAQAVIDDFWISTRTLIKWKKEHQQYCSCGK